MSDDISQDPRPLLALITEHEGFRSSAYRDSEGFLTIGIGTLIDERRGGGITREEAQILLANRVAITLDRLHKALPWWVRLDPIRRMVLADMAFNLGIDGLLGFYHTLRAVELGNYEAAAVGMEASLWYRQVGRRAVRLTAMMRLGVPQPL